MNRTETPFLPRQIDHRLQALVVAFTRDLKMIERAIARAQGLFHRMDSVEHVHLYSVYSPQWLRPDGHKAS